LSRTDPIQTAAADVLPEGTTLRAEQHEAIEAVLQDDTIAVLATGSGKTLVYVVAGRMLGGLTVVVSPTIALQADQVAALREAGLRAETFNSTRSASRRRRVLEQAAAGELDVVLLAPEQLADDDVVEALAAARPVLLAVDEAHCVSAWGVDFRPDYLALAPVVEALGRPRVLALTATAPPQLRRVITRNLGMQDVRTIVGAADRPEIHLSAQTVRDEDAVADRVQELLAEDASGSSRLVYVATRRRAEELAAEMVEAGVDAVAYHGAMRRAERDRVHVGFRDGSLRTVVATSAFGLGVDQPDVRLVVHADPPDTLDEYWQEAGRAGRDGEPASAVLLSRPDGYGLRRFFAASAGASEDDLRAVVDALADARTPLRPADVARASGLSSARSRRALNVLVRTGAVRESGPGARLRPGPGRDQRVAAAVDWVERVRVRQETGVELVRRYAETTDCRRRLVLELLGESHPEPCGRCDSCDAGTSEPAVTRPYPIGTRVEHDEWGTGQAVQYEADRVVVLFDRAGYRTLDLEAVREHHLLDVVEAAPKAG
jgi:ATP-dependent DNA helicase RecQ